ncbi:hypothetical protein PFISCL1PPCAC_25378, partial [Pristionchus fissidentatus]
MPPPKRGISAKGRPDTREDQASPISSPRRKVNDVVTPRGGKGVRNESPEKGSASRKPRTTEDVRAEASPIIPRGRGRPPSNKGTPVVSKVITEPDVSPTRRSRRITEQAADEAPILPSSTRARLDSQSTIASRRSAASPPPQSPMTTPRRGRKKSEMDPPEEAPETGSVEVEGRGKRKRKLTEAAEAAQSQVRSRKSSRRVSEQQLQLQQPDEMETILEELTEPIEEEEEVVHHEEEQHEEQLLEEVVHEEMVHTAGSPQEMMMQPPPHLVDAHHQLHSVPMMGGVGVGGARTTRGMHIVSDHDTMGGEGQQMVEEEEGHALEEMVVYDDDGSLLGYDGEEMAHEEVIEGDEEEAVMHAASRHHALPAGGRGGHLLQPHEMKEEVHGEGEEEDDDDDLPPQLEPEEGPGPDEILMAESMERGQQMMDGYDDQYIRIQSPGGTQYMTDQVDGDMYVEGVDGGGLIQGMLEGDGGATANDLRTVEFNFLDNKHICCGLCGEIVPYDLLLREHLPMHHPEVYGEGQMDLEEISYDSWLKDKLYHDKKSMENGFRTLGYNEQQQGTSQMSRLGRNTRVLRRVSQVRVNPGGMTLQQLDIALKKKMIEKMGRKVKVSLVDKQHARCGICNAVVSLNKKFEVIHLVRHFNAWHPSSHRCAGTWPNRANLMGPGKPLSCQDFAVVDVALDAPESLQCIWCGMFMDRTMLAMHFHEVHPDDVEVPKCHLCLQEVVISARLLEKYGEDFEIILPDEHHIKCQKIGNTFSTEAALDRCIERRLRRMQAVENGDNVAAEEEEEEEGAETEDMARQPKDPQYSNSRMNFGRRNKPKRNFIMPSLRQAIPQDSQYVEALSEGQWRCKLCEEPILAAVISAGAIKHFRMCHPEQMEDMQMELCKARLERVSDGCMEFVHPQLIECLICNLTYALHKPYNMCRGIRHLKTKHPEMMPEYNRSADVAATATMPKNPNKYRMAGYGQQRGGHVAMGDYVEDPEIISKLKQEYDFEFDKVQTMYGPDGEAIYVLVPDGEEVDEQTAENIQASIMEQPVMEEGDEEEE